MRGRLWGTGAVIAFISPALARATPPFDAWDLKSLFYIAKSENKNEVHYGLKLDAQCGAIGSHPVFAYWQMNSRAPPDIEDLGFWEAAAYGIASQKVNGADIRLILRAFGDRPIDIRVARSETGCVAALLVTIAKVRARLDHVYVDVGFFGPRSLTLVGTTDAGVEVAEVITR